MKNHATSSLSLEHKSCYPKKSHSWDSLDLYYILKEMNDYLVSDFSIDFFQLSIISVLSACFVSKNCEYCSKRSLSVSVTFCHWTYFSSGIVFNLYWSLFFQLKTCFQRNNHNLQRYRMQKEQDSREIYKEKLWLINWLFGLLSCFCLSIIFTILAKLRKVSTRYPIVIKKPIRLLKKLIIRNRVRQTYSSD